MAACERKDRRTGRASSSSAATAAPAAEHPSSELRLCAGGVWRHLGAVDGVDASCNGSVSRASARWQHAVSPSARPRAAGAASGWSVRVPCACAAARDVHYACAFSKACSAPQPRTARDAQAAAHPATDSGLEKRTCFAPPRRPRAALWLLIKQRYYTRASCIQPHMAAPTPCNVAIVRHRPQKREFK